MQILALFTFTQTYHKSFSNPIPDIENEKCHHINETACGLLIMEIGFVFRYHFYLYEILISLFHYAEANIKF